MCDCSLSRTQQEGHPLDNLLLEIKSYKFAQNRDFKECMRPAVEVALDLAGAGTGQVATPWQGWSCA